MPEGFEESNVYLIVHGLTEDEVAAKINQCLALHADYCNGDKGKIKLSLVHSPTNYHTVWFSVVWISSCFLNPPEVVTSSVFDTPQ